MVNAGLASGEQTAWALRKNNPQLKRLLDEFIAPRAVGSSFGKAGAPVPGEHRMGGELDLATGDEEV